MNASPAAQKKPKIETVSLDFLDAKQTLQLKPREPSAAFPEDAAKKFRVFPEWKQRFDAHGKPDFSLSDEERRLLAKWYASKPEPKVEADDLDGRIAKTDLKHASFAGTLPDHLAFNPLPLESLILPRLRGLLDGLGDLPIQPFHRIGSPSTNVYPWCTVGRIFRSWPPYTEESGWCTGWVFGGRVMVTARHAFPKNIHDSFNGGVRYRFVPGYNPRAFHPEQFGSAYVSVVRGKKENSGSFLGDGFFGDPNGWDYAACLLDNRIGDITGGLGAYAFYESDSYKNRYYNSMGYPSSLGGSPAQEILTQVRDVDGGSYERELETVNFASPGWSGGPLFGYLNKTGDVRVVGVCSGSEWMDTLWPPYNNCVWAGGMRLIDLLNYTVDNWWDW